MFAQQTLTPTPAMDPTQQKIMKWMPVMMVLFGFGMKAIVLTTTMFAIWIIVLNSRAGVMHINRSLIEMPLPWMLFLKFISGQRFRRS